MRRRRPENLKRRAVVSAGPTGSSVAGRVHAALHAGLPPTVEGLPVQTVWPLDVDDVSTLRYHWQAGVFHLDGDVESGVPVYRAAWEFPGLLVLHAFVMDEVVRSLASVDESVAWASHREIIEGRAELGRDPVAAFVPSVSPSVAAIVRRAYGIVVFAEAARVYLRALGCRTPVTVLAPPDIDGLRAVAEAATRAPAVRGALGGPAHLVVVPTDRAEPGAVSAVLDAVRQMDLGVHIALVGSGDPGRDVAGLDDDDLGDRLHVHHDLGDGDLLSWIAAADVIVDLRRPHHVEVAVGLARALAAGRPLVCAADALTPGAPLDAAVTVAADAGADEVRGAVKGLLDDADRRRALGAAAQAFADRRSERSGDYAGAIGRAVTGALDPVRPAMDRWASALADLQVDDAYLEAGYFTRYARALVSFRGTSHEAARSAADPLLDSP